MLSCSCKIAENLQTEYLTNYIRLPEMKVHCWSSIVTLDFVNGIACTQSVRRIQAFRSERYRTLKHRDHEETLSFG